jgi:hypothetical protein
MNNAYWQKKTAMFLFFDITNPESFYPSNGGGAQKGVNFRYEEKMYHNYNKQIIKYLIGNNRNNKGERAI